MSKLSEQPGLSDHDRAELRKFEGFLTAVKGFNRDQLRAWIEEEPFTDERLEYLGLTREWARKHGCDV